MKAAIFNGPGRIDVGSRPDPVIATPADAIVRVVLGCVCGSDLGYGRIDPGRVFDFETDLDGIAEGYKAMNERRAVKSLVRIGTV